VESPRKEVFNRHGIYRRLPSRFKLPSIVGERLNPITRVAWVLVAVFTTLSAFAPPASEDAKLRGPVVVEISVNSNEVINTMRGGIGASWHAIEEPIPIGHGGSGWGAYPPADDERAWQQIYRHASWLGLDWNRVEVEQRIYEPEPGKFTFDSPEMGILYRILDWNQRHGTDVFFQQMWVNTAWLAYPDYRNDPTKRVHSAPQDLDAFADGLVTLIEYLIKKRGYTCIRWLCITNEPGANWSWWNSPSGPLSIGPGLAAVRKALTRHDLTVPLSGPDAGTDIFPAPLALDYASLLEAYDFHDYRVRFDFESRGYIDKQARNISSLAKLAHDQDKPVFVSEFGPGFWPVVPDDPRPNRPESVLAASEFVIRAANAGVDGFNRWSFLNRGDLDGQWQYLDTWDRRNKKLLTDFTPHPNSYFALGLLSRFIAKNSAVLATNVNGARLDGWQRVFCAAFRSPKGNITLAVINDAPVEFPLELTWAGTPASGKFYRYRYDQAEYDRADVQVNPQPDFSPPSGSAAWQDKLTPNSLTIYSTYQLKHEDPGIILDDATDPIRETLYNP
jgi:hypothetical protein